MRWGQGDGHGVPRGHPFSRIYFRDGLNAQRGYGRTLAVGRSWPQGAAASQSLRYLLFLRRTAHKCFVDAMYGSRETRC